ncbi:carboxylesterase type B, partial [Rhizobium esperanzae]|nr:carboxylesterase type B [Rhizobium esperanzae]
MFTPRLDAADDIVTIDGGVLKGERSGTVFGFKGIPYAAPPVGDLRWRNPRPAETWSGIRDARDFGPSCMQSDELPKSEDCLTLNIWTPVKRLRTPLPVMVWIYGGALAHGNTPQYPGGHLAARKVVFVSMNYRIGRLGYFAHPALMKESRDEPVGNYGYMDQLAALKWVQQNIAAFGGDPK